MICIVLCSESIVTARRSGACLQVVQLLAALRLTGLPGLPSFSPATVGHKTLNHLRGSSRQEVATVPCDQKPQHLRGHREAISGRGISQFVVAKDHNN